RSMRRHRDSPGSRQRATVASTPSYLRLSKAPQGDEAPCTAKPHPDDNQCQTDLRREKCDHLLQPGQATHRAHLLPKHFVDNLQHNQGHGTAQCALLRSLEQIGYANKTCRGSDESKNGQLITTRIEREPDRVPD